MIALAVAELSREQVDLPASFGLFWPFSLLTLGVVAFVAYAGAAFAAVGEVWVLGD